MHGLLPTPASRTRFQEARFGQLTKLSHPTADKDLLDLMAQWYTWFFLFDDQFDDGPLGVRPDLVPEMIAPFMGVLNDVSPPATNPLALALADLWGRTTRGSRSSAWLRRLARDARSYIDSYRFEAIHRAGNERLGIGEYLAHRKNSTGMRMIFDIFEIIAQADLPDHVIECEAFLALRASGVLITGLHNDIIGLEKEVARDYPFNMVVVAREVQECSLQHAIDLANAVTTGHVAAFLTAKSELPGELDALGVDAATKAAAMRTVQEYQRMIRGHYDWSLKTDRLVKIEYTTKDQPPSFLPELLVPHAVAVQTGS
ncbi:hypothetical protein GCM10027287_18300 [Bordetella muralis]